MTTYTVLSGTLNSTIPYHHHHDYYYDYDYDYYSNYYGMVY